MAKTSDDLFKRFITAFKLHGEALRPDTVDAILHEEGADDVLDWLTIVTRTPTTYRYQRMGGKTARMTGENLEAKTLEVVPPNRAAHLRRIYDRLLQDEKAIQNRCVYRFTNGKEAVVDSLMVPARRPGADPAIYIVSRPDLDGAGWLADIVSGKSDDFSKPKAIVGLTEHTLSLD